MRYVAFQDGYRVSARVDPSIECTRDRPDPHLPESAFLGGNRGLDRRDDRVSRALVSANSTINLPLPADFCCNWTRTSGVLKTSLTTDNSGGAAADALPFPSSVLGTKASVTRTERFRSATQRSRTTTGMSVKAASFAALHRRSPATFSNRAALVGMHHEPDDSRLDHAIRGDRRREFLERLRVHR